MGEARKLAAMLHFDRVTCELALDHAAGSQVELAYRRGDQLAKRRALMVA
jgi:hypothetical protein